MNGRRLDGARDRRLVPAVIAAAVALLATTALLRPWDSGGLLRTGSGTTPGTPAASASGAGTVPGTATASATGTPSAGGGTASATATPSGGASATGGASSPAGSPSAAGPSRDPFAAEPTHNPAASGDSVAPPSGGTGGSLGVAGTGNASATPLPSGAIVLILHDVNPSGVPTFIVNSHAYFVHLGQSFAGSFTYRSAYRDAQGRSCARVSYLTEQKAVCEGNGVRIR